MAQNPALRTQGLGFLTVVHDNHGYMGGYLVTNIWSRPIEFRLSTAVQPNRIQQILYGDTLQSYLCADLIGKTLFEKATTPAQCIFTNCEPVLSLRSQVDVPVVCLQIESSKLEGPSSPTVDSESGIGNSKRPLLCHPRFTADAAAVRALLDSLDGGIDLAEPFVRIRAAMSEARKVGAMSRN